MDGEREEIVGNVHVCMVIVCMAGMYLHIMQPSGRRRIGGTYSTCMQAHNWPTCGTCGWAVRRRAEYDDPCGLVSSLPPSVSPTYSISPPSLGSTSYLPTVLYLRDAAPFVHPHQVPTYVCYLHLQQTTYLGTTYHLTCLPACLHTYSTYAYTT